MDYLSTCQTETLRFNQRHSDGAGSDTSCDGVATGSHKNLRADLGRAEGHCQWSWGQAGQKTVRLSLLSAFPRAVQFSLVLHTRHYVTGQRCPCGNWDAY